MNTRSIVTNLKLPKLSGKETLADSKAFSYIDSDFKNWGLNQKGKATKPLSVEVREMTADATLQELFTSINPDLEMLVLSQAQILKFIELYRNFLREAGYATFFLFKENNEFFVAFVSVHESELEADVYRLEYDDVCYGGLRHRVVVPQQNLESLSSELSTLDTSSLRTRITNLSPVLRINISGKQEELVVKREVLEILK